MSKTNPAQIVRKLAGNRIVFNDRLKNGGRSIKVWGWDPVDYRRAMDQIAQAGISCGLVQTPALKYGGSNWRIRTQPV
jgi:hypothetical protein